MRIEAGAVLERKAERPPERRLARSRTCKSPAVTLEVSQCFFEFSLCEPFLAPLGGVNLCLPYGIFVQSKRADVAGEFAELFKGKGIGLRLDLGNAHTTNLSDGRRGASAQ